MDASFRPPIYLLPLGRGRGVKIARDHFMERAHRTRSIIVREIFVLVRGEFHIWICLLKTIVDISLASSVILFIIPIFRKYFIL